MNGTYQFLVYVGDVNILDENINYHKEHISYVRDYWRGWSRVERRGNEDTITV
jgi:hypothetical protein